MSQVLNNPEHAYGYSQQNPALCGPLQHPSQSGTKLLTSLCHLAPASCRRGYDFVKGTYCCCRGQLGKQVVEQLAVEHVCDLAAFQAKELTDLFGTATGGS